MRVGLFLTNQQHLDADMVAAFDEQIAMVRLARDAGWDSLFSGQHYLNEGDNQQLQLVPFLARLQAEAGEMTIGLGILLLNLHNPVYVAETVASLDVISDGRLVFGVGLGYREVEFDAFRVPRGQRVARFEETLALVKRLWTEDSVSHDSDLARLDGVRMAIRPVQRPHPPVWIAANSDAAVRRAARLGRRLVHQPARHPRDRPPPARALPRGPCRGGARSSLDAAGPAGGLLRARPRNGAAAGRSGPQGEVRRLRALGSGRGDARRGAIRAALRRAALGPLRARPRRRSATSSCGRSGRSWA